MSARVPFLAFFVNSPSFASFGFCAASAAPELRLPASRLRRSVSLISDPCESLLSTQSFAQGVSPEQSSDASNFLDENSSDDLVRPE